MNTDTTAKRAAFRALHETACFILPNPWDLGGVRLFEKLGFKAIASTSAGYAWSRGKDDGQLTRDEVLAHFRDLSQATDLPVNGDFEAGFADEPEGVGANVLLAVDTGVAGISIEDRTGDDLYPLPLAIERVKAARKAIDSSGQNVLLVGRTEGLLIGRSNVQEATDRLVAYAEAGANCLYAPGVTDLPSIRAIVSAVATKPVNVLLLGSTMNESDLAGAGVRRVSIGSGMARIARSSVENAAQMLIESGRLPTE
jgi:2-methylisocitrate lyase-like PEP mutase family enzyme